MEFLWHLSERLGSFWRLRRLELIPNYVVEASVSTIILFCVKSTKVLINYVNGRRFSAQAFSACEIWLWWRPMRWINHQHLRRFYTKENYRGNACLNYIIGCGRTYVAFSSVTRALQGFENNFRKGMDMYYMYKTNSRMGLFRKLFWECREGAKKIA